MKRRLLRKEEDSDPMSVVSNLFDVAMVFAVALMVALVSRYNMTEMFSQEDFTMVKNPGKRTWRLLRKKVRKSINTLHLRTRILKAAKKAKRWGLLMSWITARLFMCPNSNSVASKIITFAARKL